MKSKFHINIVLALGSLIGFAEAAQSLKVTASAYNSMLGQTDSTPNIAAWGDTLKPGMKSIAVSRDLIKRGLTHKTFCI